MISKLKEIVKEYTQRFPEPLTLDELKRLNYEFEKIEELNIARDLVFLEIVNAVSDAIDIPLYINQNEVDSSYVCYCLGLSKTNPLDINKEFNLPTDFMVKDIFELDHDSFIKILRIIRATIELDFSI